MNKLIEDGLKGLITSVIVYFIIFIAMMSANIYLGGVMLLVYFTIALSLLVSFIVGIFLGKIWDTKISPYLGGLIGVGLTVLAVIIYIER